MGIRLEQLTKRFDDRAVVSNVTLSVAPAELRVLLGPSGSGKSTVLRLIAGLSMPDGGRVLVDGEDLAGVPAQRRGCGFVFQSYALFRRMTVAENVEFPLRVRRVGARDRRSRRDELLEMVGLGGLGDRFPDQLSGGQQQRVALARALAHKPKLLLLDEPFGALDARIRVELRRSLHAIQRELAIPTVFVTHDQEEAFELADRIAVMASGRLVEEGEPRELYLRPNSEFVAVFLGGANLWSGETTPAGVRLGPIEVPLDGGVRGDGERRAIEVLVRPEDIAVARRREDLDATPLGEAEVVEASFVGLAERLRLSLPAIPGVRGIHPPPPFDDAYVIVDAMRPQHAAVVEPLKVGDRVWVGVRRLHALPQAGLSIVAVRGDLGADTAAEVARLAQARLTLAEGGSAESPVDLADTVADQVAELVVGSIGSRVGDRIDDSEGWLERSSDAHVLLVPPGATPMPPRRFLISVAVGEPGKDDIVFAGRLARLLGSSATLFTVLGEDASETEAGAARRFLDSGARSLVRLGVPAETVIGRGDLHEGLAEQLRGDVDLLVLGSPLPDEEGTLRWSRRSGQLLALAGARPILVVRSRVAGRRRTA